MKYQISEGDEVQLIIKLNGNKCNLNCTYCYEKQREYENESEINVKEILQFVNIFKEMKIDIQLMGGEPLLVGKSKMKEILKNIHEQNIVTKINIQTNAVLLDEEWLDILYGEFPKMELGISLDGDFLANKFRVDYLGRESITAVENALTLCTNKKRNIGIISVVNTNMLHREEEILSYFSRFQCIKGINFLPCIDYKIHTQSYPKECSINYKQYYDFIKNIFELWKCKYHNNYIIEPFFSIIRSLYHKKVSFCQYSQKKCCNIFTLYPKGIIGGCDELPTKYCNHGNMLEIQTLKELQKRQKQIELLYHAKELNKKCNLCNYYESCQEGCIGARLNSLQGNDELEYCYYRAELINYVRTKIE